MVGSGGASQGFVFGKVVMTMTFNPDEDHEPINIVSDHTWELDREDLLDLLDSMQHDVEQLEKTMSLILHYAQKIFLA